MCSCLAATDYELGTTRPSTCQVRVESVRFDSAKAALESGYTITEAAERVDYGSSETLRRAFVTRLGCRRVRTSSGSSPRGYPSAGANRTSATTDGIV